MWCPETERTNIECSFGCMPISSSLILVNKNSFNIARLRSPLTVTATPCSFSKKTASGPKSALNNDSFQVRRFFNVFVRIFCAPNAAILLVYLPCQDQNELQLKIWFFFAKIGIFCKSITGPLSEAKTHWMLNWLQRLNQLNFVQRHTKVFIKFSSQWCLRNVQLLRTTVIWYLWCFMHSFCHSSNILWCTHCF